MGNLLMERFSVNAADNFLEGSMSHPIEYSPAPSSNDTRECWCCGATFGVDFENCDCEQLGIGDILCSIHGADHPMDN